MPNEPAAAPAPERRSAMTALAPRRLSEHHPIYGYSFRWFAISLTGFWITLPFLYFGFDRDHVELRVGGYKYGLTFEIRWRWS